MRDRAEPSSVLGIRGGCASERDGTRAAVIQSAMSTGSKRTNRPTLTYGIRRSATSRRTCRSVTHTRSATAPMSNNVESSSTSLNGASNRENATRNLASNRVQTEFKPSSHTLHHDARLARVTVAKSVTEASREVREVQNVRAVPPNQREFDEQHHEAEQEQPRRGFQAASFPQRIQFHHETPGSARILARASDSTADCGPRTGDRRCRSARTVRHRHLTGPSVRLDSANEQRARTSPSRRILVREAPVSFALPYGDVRGTFRKPCWRAAACLRARALTRCRDSSRARRRAHPPPHPTTRRFPAPARSRRRQAGARAPRIARRAGS